MTLLLVFQLFAFSGGVRKFTTRVVKRISRNKYMSLSYAMTEGGLHLLAVAARCIGKIGVVHLGANGRTFSVMNVDGRGRAERVLLELHDHMDATNQGAGYDRDETCGSFQKDTLGAHRFVLMMLNFTLAPRKQVNGSYTLLILSQTININN